MNRAIFDRLLIDVMLAFPTFMVGWRFPIAYGLSIGPTWAD